MRPRLDDAPAPPMRPYRLGYPSKMVAIHIVEKKHHAPTSLCARAELWCVRLCLGALGVSATASLIAFMLWIAPFAPWRGIVKWKT